MKLSPFTEQIIQNIQDKYNIPVIFRHITPEAGGSINESFKIETSAGNFFVKRNDRLLYPGMFKKEARGLELLRATNALHVPEVLAIGEHDSWQYLILRFVEKGIPKNEFWDDLGRGLASLHMNHSADFGLDHDNYIGSLPQKNTPEKFWTPFFIKNRLEPLVELAVNHKKLNTSHIDLFQHLYKRLETCFPEEKPSLLHGDFWNGNFMSDSDGHPFVYDPAVYYGHREMDLAMSLMFGGFHKRFYEAYQEIYPLKEGWQDRVKIANVYPLLVHINLFGRSTYFNELESVLHQYK